MKTEPGITINTNPPKSEPQKNRWRTISIFLFLIFIISFFAYRLEIVLGKTPSLDKTFTHQLTNPPQWDTLNWVDSKAGFTTQEQTDLINFLLSLDDQPEQVTGDS